MSLPNVVFLDRATIPAQITISKPNFSHHWVEYDFTQPEQVAERIQDADIVITNKVYLGEEQLSANDKLKLIAVSATGFNNVDANYCRTQGVAVANVRGYAQQSVPEHVIAMLFALRRNIMAYHNDVARGEWQRNKQFCFFSHAIGDVAGSTLGIIGSGALGRATGELAKAIGMNVVFAERKNAPACREGFLSFTDVLAMSDVISLHCPLTQETEDLISVREFSQMKNNVILINTGRGGLVNESALVHALVSGQIAGAGVDVFTQEPADITNPLLDNATLPNLLLTPHVAWGSDSAIQQLADILIDNLNKFMQGIEQNRVV